MHQKWGKTKLIGSRIVTIEFDNKSFWKFTTALGRKLSDGHLFFTKLFLTVRVTGISTENPTFASQSSGPRKEVRVEGGGKGRGGAAATVCSVDKPASKNASQQITIVGQRM